MLRFLLPQLDRERGAYGVKENTLAKIYIRILCLPRNGSDAMKLLEFRYLKKTGRIFFEKYLTEICLICRAPKTGGNHSCDFAEVAYWILRTRCSKGEGLLISQINDHLDAIALKHANCDPRMYIVQMEILEKNN